MTLQDVFDLINKYQSIVIGKKIGDAGHTIEGFGLKEISPGNYDVYVIGQDLRSHNTFVHKPLSEWLEENGY